MGSSLNSETNRQAFGARGVKYAPGTGDSAPGPDSAARNNINRLVPGAVAAEFSHFEGGQAFSQSQAETISQLSALLEKAHQNSKDLLKLIVDGVKKHESTAQIIAEVQAQVKAMPMHQN